MALAIILLAIGCLAAVYESMLNSHEIEELKRRVRDLEFDEKMDHKDIAHLRSEVHNVHKA